MARSSSEPPAGHIEPRSSFSGITSLSYVSSSEDPSRRFSFNRPEASSSSNLHERTDGQGLLLLNDTLSTSRRSGDDSVYQPTLSIQQAPQVFVQEVASSYDDSEQSSTRPRGLARSFSARTGSDADRGSVRTYDDSVSVLGASTARAAIRGLSPRTSEATFATFGIGRRGDDRLSVQLDRLEESPAAPPPPPPLPKEPSRERLLSDTTLHSDSDDSEGAGRSVPRLPPHPPLPSMPPTPTQPSTSQTTPRPAYVISRSMGSGTPIATPANPVTPANAPTRASVLPPPLTALSRHSHSRSLSSDLLSPLGRRPLGPRDSKH
ncbi:hypothetical protein Moror_10336 [Moniliophthora roreri MCA 2997]|uniref:Uncharacterized protein n=1 Tax=Moniliophthora roreri (strain MCA 2997) TaxID=1381753 RepID=V2XE98_MONRO|nr:hypothetical protein Moror_10336 [Moniliophthora roreri MCA 2997]